MSGQIIILLVAIWVISSFGAGFISAYRERRAFERSFPDD